MWSNKKKHTHRESSIDDDNDGNCGDDDYGIFDNEDDKNYQQTFKYHGISVKIVLQTFRDFLFGPSNTFLFNFSLDFFLQCINLIVEQLNSFTKLA